MSRNLSLLVGAAVVLVLAVGCGSSSTKKASTSSTNTTSTVTNSSDLAGNVGPGFTITLTQGGNNVTALKAGTYKITVNDQSSMHNFHLFGPQVDKLTDVSSTGTVVWNVTFVKGDYTYRCDVHFAQGMIGHFTVT